MGKQLVGSCKKCGACCRVLLHQESWDTPDSKRELLEFHSARGGRLVVDVQGLLLFEHKSQCVKLRKNNCRVHDGKPAVCRKFPHFDWSVLASVGIDANDLLPKGCGFRYE